MSSAQATPVVATPVGSGGLVPPRLGQGGIAIPATSGANPALLAMIGAQGGASGQDNLAHTAGNSAAAVEQDGSAAGHAAAAAAAAARSGKRLSFKRGDPQGEMRMVVHALQNEPLFQLDGVYGLVFSSVQTQWKNLLALAESDKESNDALSLVRPGATTSLGQVLEDIRQAKARAEQLFQDEQAGHGKGSRVCSALARSGHWDGSSGTGAALGEGLSGEEQSEEVRRKRALVDLRRAEVELEVARVARRKVELEVAHLQAQDPHTAALVAAAQAAANLGNAVAALKTVGLEVPQALLDTLHEVCDGFGKSKRARAQPSAAAAR